MQFAVDNWSEDKGLQFKFDGVINRWVMMWVSLDKTNKGINIERFGVKFNYCMFCGKEVKGLE
jgi:hypothetical protein